MHDAAPTRTPLSRAARRAQNIPPRDRDDVVSKCRNRPPTGQSHRNDDFAPKPSACQFSRIVSWPHMSPKTLAPRRVDGWTCAFAPGQCELSVCYARPLDGTRKSAFRARSPVPSALRPDIKRAVKTHLDLLAKLAKHRTPPSSFEPEVATPATISEEALIAPKPRAGRRLITTN
jgi:hypothetical protein